jgi:acyl dehydratase
VHLRDDLQAIVDAVLGGDAGQVGSYGARFAGVVFPGETLHASIWRDDGRPLASVIAPARDNAPVLSGVELVPG